MIIAILPASKLLVKPGIRRHINLASKDRLDPLGLTFLIKIDHAIHHSMVCNGRAVHSQLLDPLYIFFYFVGAVQKTVFCVDMQMCKCHKILIPEQKALCLCCM